MFRSPRRICSPATFPANTEADQRVGKGTGRDFGFSEPNPSRIMIKAPRYGLADKPYKPSIPRSVGP